MTFDKQDKEGNAVQRGNGAQAQGQAARILPRIGRRQQRGAGAEGLYMQWDAGILESETKFLFSVELWTGNWKDYKWRDGTRSKHYGTD
jgi:hypothetical protein